MTETHSAHLDKHALLALRGLRLPVTALKNLRSAGIYCEPAVSIERHSGQFVLRGVESGGAAGELGAYCSFVTLDGGALPLLHKVESLAPNGVHATVIAPELVRVQIFRHKQTCALLITHHWLDRGLEGPLERGLESVPKLKRPKLRNDIIFHGRYGTIPDNPEAPGPASGPVPEFCTRGGDPRSLPAKFVPAVQWVTSASACIGCKHCHLLAHETAIASQREAR